ncbi:MAG: alpha/beta fold hydrolase, partial [Hyphomicrobiaceae bacterium]
PTGMGLAIRHPDRIKRVVSVNGPTPAGQPDLLDRVTTNAAHSPWFQWILKAQGDGVLEQVLGQLDYNILSTLKLNGFERNEIITESWLDAYRAPFPTPKDAAGGIGWAKGFATAAHRFEEPNTATKRKLAGKDALAIWGESDRTLHAEYFLPLFTQTFPNGRMHRLSGAGHYSPEDAPEDVARLVAEFIVESAK